MRRGGARGQFLLSFLKNVGGHVVTLSHFSQNIKEKLNYWHGSKHILLMNIDTMLSACGCRKVEDGGRTTAITIICCFLCVLFAFFFFLFFYINIIYSTTPGLYKDLRHPGRPTQIPVLLHFICPGKIQINECKLPEYTLQNTNLTR